LAVLLVALLLFAHLGCVDCSGSGQFTNVSVVCPIPLASSTFLSRGQPTFSNGTVVNLPGVAVSEGSRGVVYNGAVYLVSAAHDTTGSGSNDY
jgi:hypothetical protein